VKKKITIIGGGLAGAEAAYQAARSGLEVDLHEMRPQVLTEAHQSGLLAEMVCSNSLGSEEATSASGLLKRELRLLDSFFLRHADAARVPAGGSLSVDRLRLAADVTSALTAMPGLRVIRGEVREIPAGDAPLVVASGPLTSPALAQALSGLTLRKHLYFYDATCPLLRAASIDFSKLFAASRYEKGSPISGTSRWTGSNTRRSRARSSAAKPPSSTSLKRASFSTPACRWRRSPAAGRSRWLSVR
jgi:methylenetetrahydrofolate--tRNA-(uracil-5-)-methyltransferase